MSGPAYHGWTHSLQGTDPIPGRMVWARRRKWSDTDQTITSASETGVTFNSFVNPYPEWFDDDGTGGIKVLEAGFYSILARLFWSDWPDGHELTVNGVDTDAFAGYTFHAGPVDNTLVITAALDARLSANQIVYLSVYHEYGSGRDLNGTGGCFLEIRRTDDVTVTDTDGGP